MKGKGCLRFFLYTFLLAFANGFIEDFLNIDLNGVTKILSIIIIAIIVFGTKFYGTPGKYGIEILITPNIIFYSLIFFSKLIN